MNFKCETCGEIHTSLPAIGFNTPQFYEELSDSEKLELAEISDDLCVIKYEDQTDRFIRTVLTIPIIDACDDLDYGIWVSVSEKTFNEYKDTFETTADPQVYFGMICNEITDYENSTLHLHVNVETQNSKTRPTLIPHEDEHPLVQDWKNGITLKEALMRIKTL